MATHNNTDAIKKGSPESTKNSSSEQNVEHPLPVKQQSVLDELNKLNYKDVSKICKKIEDQWYKKNIEEKFIFPETEKEKDEQRQKIYATLKDQLAESSWWSAEVSATINNTPLKMEFVLNFYDANKFSQYEPKVESLKNPSDLCWLLIGHALLNGKEYTTSSSACLIHIARIDNQYFAQMRSYDDDMTELISYFAIPLPIENQNSPWMYLPNGSVDWQKETPLYWKSLSPQEVKKQQEKFQLKAEEKLED